MKPDSRRVCAYDYTGTGLNATYGVVLLMMYYNAMGYDNVCRLKPPTYVDFAANQGALQPGAPLLAPRCSFGGPGSAVGS